VFFVAGFSQQQSVFTESVADESVEVSMFWQVGAHEQLTRVFIAPMRREDRWGLDHGTWSVLLHVCPQPNIQLVQLSIDETQPPSFHHEICKRLALLREEGDSHLGKRRRRAQFAHIKVCAELVCRDWMR
jgi:hypothetical protein